MKDYYKKLPIVNLTELVAKNQRWMKECLIFGNFGAYNIGDEAILAGQIQELQKKDKVHITVVSRYPEQVENIHSVHAIPMFGIWQILKTIISTDAVFIGGGGLFCKNDRGLKGFAFQLYTLIFFLMIPLLLQKKVYIIGIGFYDDTNDIISNMLAFLAPYTSAFIVRDENSYLYAKRKGIIAQFLKDNSFLMNVYPKQQMSQHSFFAKKYSSRRYNIGLALKKPRDISEEKKFISAIATFMKRNNRNTHFWLYSLDTHPRYSSDHAFAQTILRKIDKRTRQSIRYDFIPMDKNPKWVFSSFRLMNFVIAERLHSSIFSYRLKIPFMGISYDKKCDTFLESIGRRPIQIKEVNAKLLQKHFDAVKYVRSAKVSKVMKLRQMQRGIFYEN